MRHPIKGWITPPVFEHDEIKTHRARLLYAALIAVMAYTPIILVGNWLGGRTPATTEGVNVLVFAFCALLWYSMRRGQITLAGIGLLTLGAISITAAAGSLGTIRTPTTAWFLLLVIVGGFLFDLPGIVVTTVLSSLAIFGLITAENAGLLPPADRSVTITQWVTYTVLCAVSGGLTYYSVQSTRDALKRADRELAERKQAEERIRNLNRELEQQAEQLKQMNSHLEEVLAKEQVAREEAETGRNILETLMQYAPDIIVVGDARELQVRMISASGIELTGRPVDEIVGVAAEKLSVLESLFAPDGTTRLGPQDLPGMRAMQRGEVVLNSEIVLGRPNGEKRTLLASAAPVRDRDGKITGSIAVWRDITTRKRVEEHVEQLNRDLERRAVELEVANNELESFSFSISHDLRTPLASIGNFASRLLQDYDQLPPDARRLVELIQGNSTAMTQLVEGLLEFSRFVRQPIHRQRVDVKDLVRQVLGDLHPQKEGRKVEVSIGELPPCQADPLLLKQVWINLLSNALKFTRDREVAQIEIGAKTNEKDTTLYFIRDNGVGFDPTRADKLFGVFQRLHAEEEYEGTGVGLAIFERIIRRHGGQVRAEGEVDHGATFYFTLPA